MGGWIIASQIIDRFKMTVGSKSCINTYLAFPSSGSWQKTTLGTSICHTFTMLRAPGLIWSSENWMPSSDTQTNLIKDTGCPFTLQCTAVEKAMVRAVADFFYRIFSKCTHPHTHLLPPKTDQTDQLVLLACYWRWLSYGFWTNAHLPLPYVSYGKHVQATQFQSHRVMIDTRGIKCTLQVFLLTESRLFGKKPGFAWKPPLNLPGKPSWTCLLLPWRHCRSES